jgi:hypothetical protein
MSLAEYRRKRQSTRTREPEPATAVSSFSMHAGPVAPVAMPLRWEGLGELRIEHGAHSTWEVRPSDWSDSRGIRE